MVCCIYTLYFKGSRESGSLDWARSEIEDANLTFAKFGPLVCA